MRLNNRMKPMRTVPVLGWFGLQFCVSFQIRRMAYADIRRIHLSASFITSHKPRPINQRVSSIRTPMQISIEGGGSPTWAGIRAMMFAAMKATTKDAMAMRLIRLTTRFTASDFGFILSG
jgi:hypothetical protein